MSVIRQPDSLQGSVPLLVPLSLPHSIPVSFPPLSLSGLSSVQAGSMGMLAAAAIPPDSQPH